MLLTIVNKEPDELKANEAIIYENKNGTRGLIFPCPKCGVVSTGTHIYNPKTKTLKPSIVCNAKRPNKKGVWVKCTYHGYLRNGVFTNA